MKILETERLLVRTVEVDDAAFYLELVNSPGFIANIGDRGLRTEDAAREAIRTGPVAMQAARGHAIWLVEIKESGVAIGMSGLIKRDTLDEVDIGYAFLPAYHGHGYAVEAARAVVDYGRDVLGLKRLAAIITPGNAASYAVVDKLGMVFSRMVYLTPSDTGTRLYEMTL
ncbi:MAG: GNAT family N-acetyltransferase [Pseudomonadota bacterium]